MVAAVKLVLRDSGGPGGDWWVIERASYSGDPYLERIGENAMALRDPARISDADVEGTAEEMREIAKAIRARTGYRAKRCAVKVDDGNDVRFWSPRNSQRDGATDLASADELAAMIEATVGAGG